jgi:hypothetical protein
LAASAQKYERKPSWYRLAKADAQKRRLKEWYLLKPLRTPENEHSVLVGVRVCMASGFEIVTHNKIKAGCVYMVMLKAPRSTSICIFGILLPRLPREIQVVTGEKDVDILVQVVMSLLNKYVCTTLSRDNISGAYNSLTKVFSAMVSLFFCSEVFFYLLFVDHVSCFYF